MQKISTTNEEPKDSQWNSTTLYKKNLKGKNQIFFWIGRKTSVFIIVQISLDLWLRLRFKKAQKRYTHLKLDLHYLSPHQRLFAKRFVPKSEILQQLQQQQSLFCCVVCAFALSHFSLCISVYSDLAGIIVVRRNVISVYSYQSNGTYIKKYIYRK